MQKIADDFKQEFLEQLGFRLKEIRNSKGISQFDLSIESGLPKTQVGRIERGEINTTVFTLKKVTNALGVTFAEVLDSLDR